MRDTIRSLIDHLGLVRPLKLVLSRRYRMVWRSSRELKRALLASGFQQIYEKHINGGDGYKKYLDLDTALDPSIDLFYKLNLESGKPLRVLDIGCGPAYFLYAAKHRGHSVVGIDIEATAIF